MTPEQESAYWDFVAKDSIRIEAEVYGDMDLQDCVDVLVPYLKMDGWIFDLGCGVGRLTHTFANLYPKAHFIGIDSSPLMVDTARLMAHNSNVRFVKNDGRDLPLSLYRSFDGGYSTTMFQHIPHEAQADYLKDVRQVLKPDGRFRLQFVFEGEEGPLSYPTPVKDMLGWCDQAGLRETDIGMGLIHDEWCWLTLVKT